VKQFWAFPTDGFSTDGADLNQARRHTQIWRCACRWFLWRHRDWRAEDDDLGTILLSPAVVDNKV